MTTRVLVALLGTLAPATAWACASCIASAYGDRTFNWAFFGLILTPFAVAGGIGGVFAYRHYRHRTDRGAATDPVPLEETL